MTEEWFQSRLLRTPSHLEELVASIIALTGAWLGIGRLPSHHHLAVFYKLFLRKMFGKEIPFLQGGRTEFQLYPVWLEPRAKPVQFHCVKF